MDKKRRAALREKVVVHILDTGVQVSQTDMVAWGAAHDAPPDEEFVEELEGMVQDGLIRWDGTLYSLHSEGRILAEAAVQRRDAAGAPAEADDPPKGERPKKAKKAEKVAAPEAPAPAEPGPAPAAHDHEHEHQHGHEHPHEHEHEPPPPAPQAHAHDHAHPHGHEHPHAHEHEAPPREAPPRRPRPAPAPAPSAAAPPPPPKAGLLALLKRVVKSILRRG